MIVLEIIFLAFFWAFVLVCAILLWYSRVPRDKNPQTPKDFGLEFTACRFPTPDGQSLSAWKIPGEAGKPWILLCHGLGSQKADLLPIAHELHHHGLNCFLFDFRAHGQSSGRLCSFGLKEQRDIEGALIHLAQDPDVPDSPLGIVGISMGGAAALMTAARDERLGAVAADGPYPELEQAFQLHQRTLFPFLPFGWVRPFLRAAYRLIFGAPLASVAPLQSAAGLEHCPVLLMSGSEDAQTPPASLQSLAQRIPLAQVRLFHGAGHLESYHHYAEDYVRALLDFFLDELPEPMVSE